MVSAFCFKAQYWLDIEVGWETWKEV
jgi:hypothetical protein